MRKLVVSELLQISLSGELGLVSFSLSGLLFFSELLLLALDGFFLILLGLLLLVNHLVELLGKGLSFLLLKSGGFLSNLLLLLSDLINFVNVVSEVLLGFGFDLVEFTLLEGELLFLLLDLLLSGEHFLGVTIIGTSG